MMACTSPALTVEVDALEDLFALGLYVQILDIEHECLSSDRPFS